MELFDKQVKHYTDKYNELKKVFEKRDYAVIAKTLGVEDVKEAFKKNDDTFEKFVLAYANVMPGKVSCTAYAAAVARICEDNGIKYKIYTGFCEPKNFVKYKTDKKTYNERKKKGEKHPMFPTHVYLETEDKKIYEYYNGEKDIDHIDVVEIA